LDSFFCDIDALGCRGDLCVDVSVSLPSPFTGGCGSDRADFVPRFQESFPNPNENRTDHAVSGTQNERFYRTIDFDGSNCSMGGYGGRDMYTRGNSANE
jgi:hypothetical protein